MAGEETRKATDIALGIMLRAAEEAECHLAVSSSRNGTLIGLCPFHESTKFESARTLFVETQRGRFTCHNCQVTGMPATFMASLWHTTVRDAHMLMNLYPDAGLARPAYPDSYRQSPQNGALLHRPLNSAVNTAAEKWFRANIQTNYPALRLLAELGTPPEALLTKGIGYSPGEGIEDYLRDQGFSERDIQASPLVNPGNHRDWASGYITIADRDYSGGTAWLTAFEPQPKQEWSGQLPRIKRLDGRRPELLNGNNLGEGAKKVVMTDDPRIYILLRARDLPAVLTTYKAPAKQAQRATYTGGIQRTITRKEIKQVSLLMTQGRALRLLSEELMAASPKVSVIRHTPQETFAYLINGLPEESELLPPRRTRPRKEKKPDGNAKGGEKEDQPATQSTPEPKT